MKKIIIVPEGSKNSYILSETNFDDYTFKLEKVIDENTVELIIESLYADDFEDAIEIADHLIFNIIESINMTEDEYLDYIDNLICSINECQKVNDLYEYIYDEIANNFGLSNDPTDFQCVDLYESIIRRRLDKFIDNSKDNILECIDNYNYLRADKKMWARTSFEDYCENNGYDEDCFISDLFDEVFEKNYEEYEASHIDVEVYWYKDEETKEKIYDIESIREEFENKLKELTGKQYF